MQTVKQNWPKWLISILALIATAAITWVWTTQAQITLLPARIASVEQRVDGHDVKIEAASTKAQTNKETLIQVTTELKALGQGVEEIKAMLRSMAERRRRDRE